MSYDNQCYRLARTFIPDEPGPVIELLAQAIQDAIEDFLTYELPTMQAPETVPQPIKAR